MMPPITEAHFQLRGEVATFLKLEDVNTERAQFNGDALANYAQKADSTRYATAGAILSDVGLGVSGDWTKFGAVAGDVDKTTPAILTHYIELIAVKRATITGWSGSGPADDSALHFFATGEDRSMGGADSSGGVNIWQDPAGEFGDLIITAGKWTMNAKPPDDWVAIKRGTDQTYPFGYYDFTKNSFPNDYYFFVGDYPLVGLAPDALSEALTPDPAHDPQGSAPDVRDSYDFEIFNPGNTSILTGTMQRYDIGAWWYADRNNILEMYLSFGAGSAGSLPWKAALTWQGFYTFETGNHLLADTAAGINLPGWNIAIDEP